MESVRRGIDDRRLLLANGVMDRSRLRPTVSLMAGNPLSKQTDMQMSEIDSKADAAITVPYITH
jgi:hypothetical protein